MISFERYAALLRAREVRHTIAISALGRLPIGITGLGIVLLVQSSTGSFAFAGVASGAYVVGLAALAPVLGRIIDRYGPTATLLASALLFPAALGSLVAAAGHGASPTIVLALAAAAGAAFPPISVCMRTYLKRRFADEALLTAAYSLESVLIELIFIAGPMLVALFVAIASPAAAVVFAALCGSAGTLLFVRSPALRAWSVDARTHGGFLGPIGDLRFVALVTLVLAYSTAFGLMEIGVVAYATELRRPALAGVFLGLMSVGSAAGGLAYGSRSWRFPLVRQFAAMLALMGIGLAVLALEWQAPAFATLCILAGVVMAPALIIQAMLVAKTARAEHSTEAFTWSTSALLCGIGLGLAFGGGLLETFSARSALGAGALTAFAAALGARLILR